ncbi:autotransporter-associated beta strand repeat-containing protein [Luteolibacter arcticus]|uniref:Autotransporter-associated beta strand repeat-containing protein n=1 Tax=Luteolibacter arcticus TaxID=1581411 RepID=A0ABT3GNI4_9BACT|nr:autotransporter-associated beta strand repeat-containing protein [Luteolibacter arcticus]MCW1925079.1 autotransporter-associated beta strand repeat-containing protein [Luteolibacter arcticus]
MKALLCPALLGALATVSHAGLVGLWKFDDSSNLGKATFGTDLTVAGTAPVWSADATYGTTTLTGVITTVSGIANRLVATHGIGANGGNANRAAEYTLVYDIRRPTGNLWRTFYQTDLTNGNDAEYFTRGSGGTVNSLGRSTSAYTSFAMPEDQWLRITIAVKLGTSFTTYMTNAAGTTSTFQHNILTSANTEYSLDPSQVLLFADNTAAETNPLTIGQVAIYSHALAASEVATLGTPGTAIPLPGNIAPAMVIQNAGSSPVAPAVAANYSFSATDTEGDQVQFEINWGDGQTDAWSPLQAVGTPYQQAHTYAFPGSYVIQARVRDSANNTTSSVVIQTISVEGKALTWTGSLGSEWSTGTLNAPKNWLLTSDGITTADFATGDDVTFGDAPSSSTIAINGSDVIPHVVTVNRETGSYTLTGDHGMAGPGTLVKTGGSTLVLANPNPLQGNTTITSGTLRLDHPLALSNSVIASSFVNGGLLAFGNITAATIGGLAGNNDVSLSNPSNQAVTLTVGKDPADFTAAYAGPIAGSGSLVKAGTGTQVLGYHSTFTGGTTLNAGALRMEAPEALGTGAITHAGGSLAFSFGSGEVANNITLPATAYQTFIVRAANNAAPTTLTEVALAGKLSGGTAGLTYRLVDSNVGSNHFNVLSLVNPANDFSGTIELWRGFLAFNSDAALGNPDNDLRMDCNNGNGGLRFDADGITLGATRSITLVATNSQEGFTVPTGTGTIAGPVTGVGAMIKRGEGELVLAAANTFTGSAAVAAGKLTVNGSIATSANPVTVTTGGTLGGSGTINRTITAAGTIAPGSGTGVLSASAATITGTLAVEINGLSHDQLAVTGSLNVTGATLDVSLLGDGFTQGSYVIATCTGTPVGTFATVTPGYSVSYEAGQIVLHQQTATGFESWATSKGVSGFDIDSDGDGIPNGIEFVIGGEPAPGAGSNSAALLPKASYDKLTGNLVIVFRRMPGSLYLAPVVEHSPSPSGTWTDGPAGSVVGNEGGADLVEVRLPSSLATGGRLFARLKVEE